MIRAWRFINPAHLDFKKLVIGSMDVFKMDPRLIS